MEQVTETSMEQYQVFINHWDQTPEMLLPASSIWSNTRFSSTTKGQTPRILLPVSSTITSHCIVCALRVSTEVVEGWKEALREAGGTDISALQFKTKERNKTPQRWQNIFITFKICNQHKGFRSQLGTKLHKICARHKGFPSILGTKLHKICNRHKGFPSHSETKLHIGGRVCLIRGKVNSCEIYVQLESSTFEQLVICLMSEKYWI